MRGPKVVPAIVGSGPWICRTCLRGRQKSDFQAHRARATTRLSLESIPLRGYRTGASAVTLSTSGDGNSWSHLSDDRKTGPKPKGRRRLIFFTAISSAALIFAFTDTAQHSYAATKRSLRVLNALIRSVREYVLPLNTLYYPWW